MIDTLEQFVSYSVLVSAVVEKPIVKFPELIGTASNVNTDISLINQENSWLRVRY